MVEPPGFTRFWMTWPKNAGRYSRKGAKAECLKRWNKHYHETQADTICKHVAWLATTADWLKDQGAYIPAPLVYLNQQRWDGAEIPETVSATGVPTVEHCDVVSTRRYLQARDAAIPAKPSEEIKARLMAARQLIKGA